jgi:hypothetical protein
MSPLRKPRIDRRWERHPGTGLILPRRPSRERFIEPRGTAQCCCDGSFPTCDFCGTHDGTDSVVFDLAETYIEYYSGLTTEMWTFSGSFTLDTKVVGSGYTCTWSGTGFAIPEDQGHTYADAKLDIDAVFTCVGWDVTATLYDANYVIAYSQKQYVKGQTYTTSSSGDCASRYFADYSDPESLTGSTVYNDAGIVTATWGAAQLGSS